MKSLNRIGVHPVGLTLSADDVVEFHLARILLLLYVCGISGRIDGLTKMAKLDFFVRYPEFFEKARSSSHQKQPSTNVADQHNSDEAVESAMVRHHYGPWDKRYYHVLAHLEGKELVTISKEGSSYRIKLTALGQDRAALLVERPSYGPLVQRMGSVKKEFGGKTGTALKKLIYKLFDEEIGKRPLGQVIRS